MSPLRLLSVSSLPLCFVFVAGCLDDDNTSAQRALDAGTMPLDASLPGQDAQDTQDAAVRVDGAAAIAPGIPIAIGTGFKPGLAVDAVGTSYMAWYGPETTTNTLQFCRLARGASGCDQRTTIAALGTTLTRPFVVVNGTTVRVVSHRYGLTGADFEAVYIYSSTDSGATFDVGKQVGRTPYNEAVYGPGDTVSTATHAYTPGEVFENMPTTQAVVLPSPRAVLSTDHLYSGSVGLVDGLTPLVVFADGTGNAQFRKYLSGSLNDVASWSAVKDIGYGEYMQLAGGPAGLFLKARSATNTLEIRKFDGATFAAAASVPDGTGELPQSHLAQDSSGNLHLVWPAIAADGIRFFYATSSQGAAWSTKRQLTSPDVINSMRVAASPDSVAVAAWEGPSATIRFMTIAR